MTFPSTVDIKLLDTKHPEVLQNQELMNQLGLLFKGGKELKDNASAFLVKHGKELGSVFLARLQKFHYDNVLGTICSWYTSRLFGPNQLQIDFKTDGIAKLTTDTNDYYKEFLEDCDGCSTSLARFFERVSVECLVFGKSYFLTDLPKLTIQPSSLAEQEQLGGLSPYLCHLPYQSVINWQLDDFGNYQWVVVYSKNVKQQFLTDAITVERWTYYDTQEYAVYQVSYPANKARPLTADLIDTGVHALPGEVPLTCIKADEHLWLGNRTILPLVEHLNATNSLGWSLWLSANPIPTFTDGKDGKEVNTNQTAAAYAAICLPEGATFKWIGPEVSGWDVYQRYIEALREAIFRSAHVVAMGRSSRSSDGGPSQSGISKEQDWKVAADVLNSLGTIIRQAIQDVLEDIAQIRSDGTVSDVRGFNFSEDGAAQTVDLVIEAKSLGIPSETFSRELSKMVVKSVLRDANADLILEICDEIETAPVTTIITPVEAAPAVALNVTERI